MNISLLIDSRDGRRAASLIAQLFMSSIKDDVL